MGFTLKQTKLWRKRKGTDTLFMTNPIEVQCIIKDADNKLSAEVYCPKSVTISLDIKGANTKNRPAWTYSIDFSQDQNFPNEKIGL